MKRAVPFLLWCGIAAAAAASTPPKTTLYESVPGLSEADEPAATEDLKFRRDRHTRMTVPVRLDGRGPYRFLVDTGADRTAISSTVASQLGLRLGPLATVHGVTGPKQVRLANVPRLELTHSRVRQIDAPMLEAADMGADGILGVDSLRSQRVLFDFKTQVISIVPSTQRMARDEKDAIVVTGKLRNGHLILTHARARGVGLTIVLDTGAEISVGNAALFAKLAQRKKLHEPEPVELISATGDKLTGHVYLIDELEIGQVKMQNLAVLFADAHTFSALGLRQRPALLLGMNAMRAFEKVSIDFDRKKLRLVVPPKNGFSTARFAARQGERASPAGFEPATY